MTGADRDSEFIISQSRKGDRWLDGCGIGDHRRISGDLGPLHGNRAIGKLRDRLIQDQAGRLRLVEAARGYLEGGRVGDGRELRF